MAGKKMMSGIQMGFALNAPNVGTAVLVLRGMSGLIRLRLMQCLRGCRFPRMFLKNNSFDE